MLLSLLLLCLVAAIILYQAPQGLYSGLIMVVLTICCAGAAYGTFEWVAIQWLAPMWRPDYAFALALGLTFGVPLLILRVTADRLLRRNCLLPAWIDRAGGGACSVVTAMVMVGVIATCLQQIPFNKKILDYSRFPVLVREPKDDGPNPEPPGPEFKENELMLSPDRFAFGVAAMLSDGVFSGRRSLAAENPDFVQAIGWLNSAASEVSRYAQPGSISVIRTKPLPFVYKYTPPPVRRGGQVPGTYDLQRPQPDHAFQMVRVKLKNDARDTRKSHVFTLRQFRLLGRDLPDGPLRQYHPIAIQQDDRPDDDVDTTQHHISATTIRKKDWPVTYDLFSPRESNNDEVEVVFELPHGFQSEFIEYKRGARAGVTLRKAGTGEEARPARGNTTGTTTEETNTQDAPSAERDSRTTRGSRGNRGGRVRGVTAQGTQSSFKNSMPRTLRAYTRYKNVDISRGALVDGHLVGYVDEQENGPDRAVSKFSVPSDKRLLHLHTESLRAGSALGKAKVFAVKTLQNYTVEDSNGRRYQVLGKYATADVEGRRVIEVQYFRNQAGSIGGLGKFERIKERHLTGDYQLVLLFLVEPGARIVSFATGGSASRKDDLSDLNLVAPP